MTTMPTSASDISAEWLTDALRRSGVIDEATTVTDVTAEPMAAGVGFMGEVARLRPTYAGGHGPASLIAKIPTQNPTVREMMKPARVFEREARFYLELADDLDMVARAHHVAANFDADDYVLLLEDLGHLRIGDQAVGATVEEAASALRSLARLHARFWRSPQLDTLDWMPMVNAEGMKIGREVYHASLPGFEQVFAQALDPRHADLVTRFGDNVHQLLDRFASMPTTVVHFDYRLDNLFFGDGGVVKMIDFQASSKGGGAYDVGYFLSQNLRTDVRRKHETALLRTYHDALVDGGVGDYPFEQFVDDYRVGVLYGWIIPVFAVGTLDSSSERAMALWTEVIERSQSAMTDHDVGELLR
jgi:aminoglycoside/choline kinase family phosphotransferase